MNNPSLDVTDDVVLFEHMGTSYQFSFDLIEDILPAGYSLYNRNPLQILDNVGFLKSGDDAKKIVMDLLPKVINDLLPDDHPSRIFSDAFNKDQGD